MGEDADAILEAGRAIRPHLPELLGDEAAPFDARLAEALDADEPAARRADAVLAQLGARPACAEWVAAFLEQRVPPDLVPLAERSVEPLPGGGEHVSADRYVCPRGDYTWYRRAVGQRVGRCPTHPDVALVPSPLRRP